MSDIKNKIIEALKQSEFVCTGHWSHACTNTENCEFLNGRDNGYHGYICNADDWDFPEPHDSCQKLLTFIGAIDEDN